MIKTYSVTLSVIIVGFLMFKPSFLQIN